MARLLLVTLVNDGVILRS